MFRIHELLVQGVAPPLVGLQLHLVLGLDRVLFALEVVGVETRRDEELRKTVQRLREVLGLDVEVVRRPVDLGVGVGIAAVLQHEFAEFVDLRVLVRADEQHVLDEVGDPQVGIRLVMAAPGDANGGGRHTAGPMNQKRP